MPSSTLMTPRPVPGKVAPALAALLVLGVALVVFLIAGWDVRGWALGAVLWVGLRAHLAAGRPRAQGRELRSRRAAFTPSSSSSRASPCSSCCSPSRPRNEDLALPAILVFALAYTAELGLSLASYFGRHQVKRALVFVTTLALVLRRVRGGTGRGRVRSVPRVGDERVDADPHRPARHVDQQGRRVPHARRRSCRSCSASSSCGCASSERPGRRQTVGEIVYEMAQVQVAEQGLPTKAIRPLVPLRRLAARSSSGS